MSVASVRAPGRDDTTITLELEAPVTQGQAVTVSYAPGDYAIAAAFADQPATNNTQPPPAPVCVTAPEGATAPTCAAVSGNDLIVTFNADLAPIDAATASALRFSFFVDGAYHNGAPVNFQSPGRVSVDGAALTLTLGTAVRAGDEVTIHYSASSAGNGLNDADGNPIPDFTLTVTTTAQS
ncbi:MAG: SwmB domain-containing protein [bacterium]|nr:SwmB domain-containing protein [bacterium]